MKSIRQAKMSVYDEFGMHRIFGKTDPSRASIKEGLSLFVDMLGELQGYGVKPGRSLKITIETTPQKRKKSGNKKA